MLIFLSWSGPRAQAVAIALDKWLRNVVQTTRPWLSSDAIRAGDLFSGKISEAIATAGFCVVCVTPENSAEPWLNYEAGAIAERLKGRTCPYVLGSVDYSKLKSAPLSRLQHCRADREGTRKLVHDIVAALEDSQRPLSVDDVFDKFWPDLEAAIAAIPESDAKPEPLSEGQLKAEALDGIKGNVDALRDQVSSLTTLVLTALRNRPDPGPPRSGYQAVEPVGPLMSGSGGTFGGATGPQGAQGITHANSIPGVTPPTGFFRSP
jgi:hypothetical protein